MSGLIHNAWGGKNIQPTKPAKNIKKTKNAKKKDAPWQSTLDDDFIATILSQSYIGKKGYTIPKSCLTPKILDSIYEELHAKPFIAMNCGGPANQNNGFYCYRENEKKIYIPRFYGINTFGIPAKCELVDGPEPIDVPFTKNLRDYQEKIVDTYITHCNTEQGNGGILEVPCGRGKTIMALNIISRMKTKTLVIVHKEFLMNQWIERIEDFLPSAKVGKIQGPVFDVEGKDIVIGMLQTLYIKDFHKSAFDCFGLTIVDEVHRIGSEQFSKALFKAVTKYMLGISATVERKDRLTHVLYMFIGPKIYHEEREKDDIVKVRAMHYKTNDTEFNEVELDYKGNPKYSTMISKLCSFGPRSDFIVGVVRDLICEYPEKQIMILGHNRNLLTYLHDSITHKSFASCGYYLGGMKQKDLQETETKQIVIATYAMAAEALDIKTLSTLVMVTPKTDITQSIGRILRVKNNNPIVVDIVDAHTNFINQWSQRKKFYKKNGYLINSISSDNYIDMVSSKWKCVYDPCESNGTDKAKDDDEEGMYGGKCMIQW